MGFDDYYSDYDDENELEYDMDEVEYTEDTYDETNPLNFETTIFDVCERCIEPSITAAFGLLYLPMLYCIMYTAFVRLVSRNEFTFHIASCMFGFLSLLHLSGESAVMTVMASFSSYVIATRVNKLGDTMYFWSVLRYYLTYMVVREYFECSILQENWSQVRGIHMLYLLRTLSLNYEFSTGTRTTPLTFLEYNGYMLCPATILFGPWVPYSTYLKLRETKQVTIAWLSKIGLTLMLSLLCLAMSSCGVYWIFLSVNSRWMFAIRDAMSVRFSHYFISYISETMCLLSGFYSTNGEMTQTVTSPFSIEFPRSLVEVVINWNKPMHYWLKNYIFRPLQHLGSIKAVLCTFLVSSMLHGFHFPVTMVLLSLGCFTYVEYVMREKLADIFDACIRSRRCGSNCRHSNKSTNLSVISANVFLSLLAYFHLVYLGVMMDVKETEDNQASKFDLMSTQIHRWSSLGYTNHWIILVTYITLSAI